MRPEPSLFQPERLHNQIDRQIAGLGGGLFLWAGRSAANALCHGEILRRSMVWRRRANSSERGHLA
jgi:hypothetical protein